jgi:signal transduction histidine kinase
LDAAKTDLVATVSHELKSPLTSVRMVLHLLLEGTIGSLSAKQRGFLEAAHKDTERLLRILNDLLDLARLEAGNAELHRETVAPGELWQDLVTEMSDKVAPRGLRLRCVQAPDLPLLCVDRRRMSYALANLLNNAIRFSPEGGEILLQASSTVEGDVELSVTDHGPGIAQEYHARIFDRFFRAPGQTKTGAGLGLSIAREIVVAHGGRIGVKSQLGHGARFFILLNVGPPCC